MPPELHAAELGQQHERFLPKKRYRAAPQAHSNPTGAKPSSTAPFVLSRRDPTDSSDTDRDTNFNPASSPALPVSQAAYADRLAQAEFEDAVGDGSYQADPDFDWEPAAVGETKQGCS